jgi:hypothetical protein
MSPHVMGYSCTVCLNITPVQVNTQRRKAGDEHVDAQVKFTAAHQVGPINIALSKVGLCSSFVIRPPGVISPPVTNLLQAGTAISGSGDTSCTANACADTMLRWAGMLTQVHFSPCGCVAHMLHPSHTHKASAQQSIARPLLDRDWSPVIAV